MVLSMVAPGVVECAPRSGPVVKATLKTPDLSDPTQAAIMQWHQALVANDFPTFVRVDFHTSAVSDDMIKIGFDSMRSGGMPQTVLIAKAPEKISSLGPPGLRVYMLVGCMKLPGSAGEVRLASAVWARIANGQWKVGGSSFGIAPPEFAGACPMKPAS